MRTSQDSKHRTHLPRYRQAVNAELSKIRPWSTAPTLEGAMEYVLLPGGKRLRSILTLLAGASFGERSDSLLKPAAAIELLHSASLVFDDLPAMDNARQRRGKPTLHARYTPDLAVLCGHSMVSLALHLPSQTDLSDRAVRCIVAELAFCIGPRGMAAGQADDLLGQDSVDAGDACRVAACKTGHLFRAAAYCGAIANGAGDAQAEILRNFGMLLGTSYQIADDFQDYEKEDDPRYSTNVVTSVGKQAAIRALHRHLEQARQVLDGIPRKGPLLGYANLIQESCRE